MLACARVRGERRNYRSRGQVEGGGGGSCLIACNSFLPFPGNYSLVTGLKKRYQRNLQSCFMFAFSISTLTLARFCFILLYFKASVLIRECFSENKCEYDVCAEIPAIVCIFPQTFYVL